MDFSSTSLFYREFTDKEFSPLCRKYKLIFLKMNFYKQSGKHYLELFYSLKGHTRVVIIQQDTISGLVPEDFVSGKLYVGNIFREKYAIEHSFSSEEELLTRLGKLLNEEKIKVAFQGMNDFFTHRFAEFISQKSTAGLSIPEIKSCLLVLSGSENTIEAERFFCLRINHYESSKNTWISKDVTAYSSFIVRETELIAYANKKKGTFKNNPQKKKFTRLGSCSISIKEINEKKSNELRKAAAGLASVKKGK